MANAKGRVLLTTGSREFDRKDLVLAELTELERPTFVMHGGAKGADRLVADCIQGDRNPRSERPNGIKGLIEVRLPYLAMEQKRGGHKRNEAMLEMLVAMRDAGYDCWGMAFHYDIKNPSPGTNGMVKLLNSENFSVVHIDGMTGGSY